MMRRSLLFWVLAPLLAAALVLEIAQAQRLLRASRVVNLVERTSAAAAARPDAVDLLRRNLLLVRDVLRDDPVEVRAHQAEGSLLLLLGRPRDALDSYGRAIAIQNGPELQLALGLASDKAGDATAARRHFAAAVRLDPRLAAQVPAAMR